MVFGLWKKWRRKRLLRSAIPDEWIAILRQNFAHYSYLDRGQKAKIHDELRIFVAEKHWEGCGGLTMTSEVQVTIAAQACLLTLGLDVDLYRQVETILVYPSGYWGENRRYIGGGAMVHDVEHRSGEAWYRGPVVLSWSDVQYGGQRPGDGANVVYHEFAHKLDMLTGSIDGTPPLASRQQLARWREVMNAEYLGLVRSAQNGRATLLDHYGAENEAEFFAVATECFFEQPQPMRNRHSRLYDLLRDYYRQDPASRTASG